MPWDYDKEEFEKQATADPVWYLTRVLTYGPDRGKKLDLELIKRHWDDVKDRIPPDTRAFIELLLWDKPF